ncbi:MAG: hypothetical protein J6M91_06880 [Methanobrevibacter sp.]|nr:hypothetical protein [Methanobrevibacter sp.]
MAGELIEIILQAVDNASSVFDSVGSSAEQSAEALQSAFEEANAEVERLTQELADIEMGNIEGDFDAVASELANAEAEAEQLANAMNEVEAETDEASGAMNDLGIVNSSMLLQLSEQVGQLGSSAEGMAQEMNEAAITVGQLATQTGIAEPQMVSLINNISNATFPNEEAMMYVKSLDQMGVSSENLGASATNLDKINDAFGMGAQTVNSLGQELGVLGVDMNNVSSAFNALAYANANTVGGMDNYFSFLRKYDAQFKELGYDVDQSSIIIAAATQKYGGGRAALSGLSSALEEADGDTRKLEEALGIQAGTLDHASEVTGQYEGQLEQLAGEEAEHKTILDQIGAAWEDVSLSIGSIASPLMGVVGLFGQIGQFGLQVGGIKTLVTTMKELNIVQGISNALEGEGAIARAASAIGITTEAAAAEGSTVAFGGLAIAEGAALWPILAIIAAIALFVAAVYEIGKAFGWWTDVGTMLEAIQAGITKLWEAFINHPDVQAVISVLSNAWNSLSSAVMGAINAVTSFFGVNTGGEFDIVSSIINGVGYAWNSLKEAVGTVIEALQVFYDFLVSLGEGIQTNLGGLYELFMTVWNGILAYLAPVINQIVSFVQSLINVFNQFRTGQMYLPTFILTVLGMLWNAYNTVLTRIGSFVLKFGTQMLTYAIRAGSNFVRGVIQYIQTLPGRVYSLLIGVVSRISSAIQSWISTAKSKVSTLISNITSPFSGVASAISSALSGVVSAIKAPFEAAYNAVKPILDKIKAGMDFIGGITGAAGFELGNAAGFENSAGFELSDESNVSSTTHHEVLDVNYNINIDLTAPSGMSSSDLMSVVNDRDFLVALTGNRDFQELDARVKSRISLKNSRMRGV